MKGSDMQNQTCFFNILKNLLENAGVINLRLGQVNLLPICVNVVIKYHWRFYLWNKIDLNFNSNIGLAFATKIVEYMYNESDQS